MAILIISIIGMLCCVLAILFMLPGIIANVIKLVAAFVAFVVETTTAIAGFFFDTSMSHISSPTDDNIQDAREEREYDRQEAPYLHIDRQTALQHLDMLKYNYIYASPVLFYQYKDAIMANQFDKLNDLEQQIKDYHNERMQHMVVA